MQQRSRLRQKIISPPVQSSDGHNKALSEKKNPQAILHRSQGHREKRIQGRLRERPHSIFSSLCSDEMSCFDQRKLLYLILLHVFFISGAHLFWYRYKWFCNPFHMTSWCKLSLLFVRSFFKGKASVSFFFIDMLDRTKEHRKFCLRF